MVVRQAAYVRAAIGLAQGLVLYLLYEAFVAKVWPATMPMLFAALLAVAFFVPLIAVQGYGNLRERSLTAWIVVAAIACAAVAAYDIYRDPVDLTGASRVIPGATLTIALAAGLFIAHSLITAGDEDRKLIASYPRYFDVSWKLGVQQVLAALFVAVLWGVILLGVALFQLIHLSFFATLVRQPWFIVPVTAVAINSALHVTDASVALVRGTRTLNLTLLSWLLPMMTAIAVVFLLALPFTGLQPLWSTRHAGWILLTAAAVLVFLINAAYQDGELDRPVAAVLRISRLVAALSLAPLVALAAYGLLLRVQQYGFTPRRIDALAVCIVLACYALGYLAACAQSSIALNEVRATNIATAYVVLAVLLAIFSPLADPARISVNDQVARLDSGRINPDQFDYKFLRFDAGRYGHAALAELATRTTGPQAAAIAQRARDTLLLKNRYQSVALAKPATPQSRAANVVVIHPAGRSLPESFLRQDWTGFPRRYLLPQCLTADVKCEAVLGDLDGDDQAEILLFSLPGNTAAAFKAADDGSWVLLGSIANAHCPGVRDGLRAGDFTVATPELRDLEVRGNRLRINTAQCASQPARSRLQAPAGR